MYYYQGFLSDIPVVFSFRFADTALFFGVYLLPSDPKCDAVYVPESDYYPRKWFSGVPENAYSEYSMSVYRASDALLSYGRCAFHAAAILWRGKALLFAADSGVGKSTQLRYWKAMNGEDVRILNGDKPLLHFEDNGRITVYPSPWKGKEGWGDDSISAELGGVILLQQGNDNSIKLLRPVDAAAPILRCFFSTMETVSSLDKICEFENLLLSAVPVWKLTNKGDADSALITRNTILETL